MIRLHHVPGSRSFRILWLLSEMGITPEVIPHVIGGDMHKDAFKRLSPAGRAPALEIDGLVLFESGAITQYLCETRPEHGLAPVPGSPERATFLQWLHFAETQAHLLAELNLQYVFLRDPAMRSSTVLKINTRRLAVTMQAMEDVLADAGPDQEYLLQSGFSAADTIQGFNMEAVNRYVRLDPFPRLNAYYNSLKSRAGYRAALALDGEQKFYDREFYEPADG